MTDPDIHFKLVEFCHNTRLAHLNRNLPPTTMANPACGVQTVDQAVVNEVLAKGTGNRWRSWDPRETNWHRMTVQLPPFKGGLGLTPQAASGIAAFYSGTCSFIAWLAQRTHLRHWLRQGQSLGDHTTWMAAPLVDLKHTHACLLQDYQCVEGAPAADAAIANDNDDEVRPAPHLSLPPLNMLARQHLLSEEEVVAGNCLPLQRRVTTQIMRNWAPHLTAQAQPASIRCQHLRMLHSKVTVNATSRVPEGAAGHSILQDNMPDDEDMDCDEARKKKLTYCPAAHPACLFLGKARSAVTDKDWQSWMCQFLGVSIPALVPLWKERRVCACGRHVIDEYGDHVHTCKKHTGSTKSAHETVLDAVETLCHQAGLLTERRNIPTVKK